MKTKHILFVVLAISTTLNVLFYTHQVSQHSEPPQDYIQQYDPQIETPAEETKPNITTEIPVEELSIQEVYAMLDKWHAEAPDITEVGVVGKNHNDCEIKYIRIGKKTGPKVLITAAIHGNEKLSTMTTLGVFNEILKGYMSDERITELLRTRDIYYIPIVCPDGFIKNSRHVLGRDPNRDFSGRDLSDKQSIPSVQALKNFHKEHQFKAVMSCHNFGKVYFYPWGYIRQPTSVDQQYKEILGKMSKESGYNYEQLYRQSAPPYYGYEVDWFFHNGAFSIVNEIGRMFSAHKSEIAEETKNNLPAIMTFIKEGPMVRSSLTFLDEWF